MLSRSAHPLAALLAIVLLVPGLLAGLSVCGMPECPALATATEQGGCQEAGCTALSAPCCRVELETPATPLKSSERGAAGVAGPQTVSIPLLLPTSFATTAGSSREPFPLPLDALTRTSVLRI